MFRAQLLGSCGRCSVFMLALFGFCAIASEASSQDSGTVTQPLVQAGGPWWTENGRHIPMCWHFFSQFPTTSDRDDAKTFVVQTIQDSWISLLDLSTSWADCPTSGNGKHVRVMLRIGDPSSNGTTLKAGTKTLSTAVERLVPPPNDPPGLLMGFPSNWNQSDATRSNFRALIRHEFGHILGFGHELIRPDGAPEDSCYSNRVESAVTIGPPDPTSIMGWSYCTAALETLSANDVIAARSIYGTGGMDVNSCQQLLSGCGVTEAASELLLLQ